MTISRASKSTRQTPPIAGVEHVPLASGMFKSTWAIDVPDLDALLELMRMTDEGLAIRLSYYEQEATTVDPDQQWLLAQPHIIIYDDYIE